jgi:hypothetical protein
MRTRIVPTLLALSAPVLACVLGCDPGDAADSSDETGGDGSGCFIRATLEQADGTVLAYDVAAIVDQSDPARHMIETDFLSEDTIHVLRLSWPAGLAVGTHALLGEDIAFAVLTELGDGSVLGDTWPGGSVSFTALGGGLAGSLSVPSRPAGADGVYVVEVRDAAFGCE